MKISFDITKTDLMRLWTVDGRECKRREYLGDLRIGYCNGKQLLKRLELFELVWHKSKRRWPVIKTEVEGILYPKRIRKEKK